MQRDQQARARRRAPPDVAARQHVRERDVARVDREVERVKAGGLIEQYVHAIEILCLPNDLPETIEVDISALEVGASLHIGDIKFPTGVRATHAADVVVAHIGKPAAAVSEGAAATPTK